MLQRVAIKCKPMLCGGQAATREHEGEGEGQPMHLGLSAVHRAVTKPLRRHKCGRAHATMEGCRSLLRARLPLAEWSIDLEPAIDAKLRVHPAADWHRAWATADARNQERCDCAVACLPAIEARAVRAKSLSPDWRAAKRAPKTRKKVASVWTEASQLTGEEKDGRTALTDPNITRTGVARRPMRQLPKVMSQSTG
jgi:hypothetical protein